MKNSLLILFSIIQGHLWAQDIIINTKKDSIYANIEEIGLEDVKYKRSDLNDSPIYFIHKKEVLKIIYSNGVEESFSNNEINEISLQETKDFIVEYINKYGYEEDSFKSHYKAVFEGNYLRLIELKKNSNEEKNMGILYDFSNVYKFQRVSRRSDQLAYVNIFVSILKNEKRNTWDKHKLIMRVSSPEKADSILNALKHLNKLLTDSKKGNSKF
ncbi:hypothetical protein [Corallibacter sp.]|uniref:hypothetical protein n=1 Tax=Corallibacter sp. TaxID=2038084 RepID=UPI003AB78AE6